MTNNHLNDITGDLVTPKTPAGLWLASTPVDGDYYQERTNVCVFTGTGRVLERVEWVEQDRINGVKVEYVSILIECDCGVGWAGQGAVDMVK